MCTNEDLKTGTLNDAKLDNVAGGHLLRDIATEKNAGESTEKERIDHTKDGWIVIPPIK